MSTAC